MSEELFSIAQLVMFAWPVWVLAGLLAAIRRNLRWKTRLIRARRAALAIWLVLLPAWGLAWFGPQPALSLLVEPVNSLLFMSGLIGLLSIELAPWLKKWKLISWPGPAQRIREIQMIEQLNALHPTEFEKLVQETYRRLGYSARHMGQAGDHGVDLEVRTPEGERWVVQCKRWRESVGEATVRELYGTLFHEGADRAVLVTSAEITPPAEAWARGKPIDLIDGRALLAMIERSQRAPRPNRLRQLRSWFESTFKRQPIPPSCPRCRVRMVRHPRPPMGRQRRSAYRCSNYPNCRVVVIR